MIGAATVGRKLGGRQDRRERLGFLGVESQAETPWEGGRGTLEHGSEFSWYVWGMCMEALSSPVLPSVTSLPDDSWDWGRGLVLKGEFCIKLHTRVRTKAAYGHRGHQSC